MKISGWTEVATFTKTKNGKLRDTFRVFVNELGWCKGRDDKRGRDYYFHSLDEMLAKIESLKKIRYVRATGELPKSVISQYAAFTEEI